MSCNPCAPKATVSCLAGEAGDKYIFHIHGLEEGVEYFWRLENEQGNIFSKAFTYSENPYTGYQLEIPIEDVPAGLFTAPRKLWFSLSRDSQGEMTVPFLFAHWVEEVAVQIVCDEFTPENNEIGLEVMY